MLDAQHFGVPQRRRRVVIVGRLGDSGAAPARVLLEPEGGDWDSAAGVTSGEVPAARAARGVVAALSASGVGTVSYTHLAAGLSDRASGLAYISEEIGRTVETSKDLTEDEASKVIDALRALSLSVPEENLPWVEES